MLVEKPVGVGKIMKFGACQLSKDRSGYVIITGAARSGTGYVTAVFRKAGLDIIHERYGNEGVSSHHIAPYLRFYTKSTILHQVRDPLPTIASIQTLNNKTWSGIQYFIPCCRTNNLTLRCMQYWYWWNILIDGFPVIRYQVEQIARHWDEICLLANLPSMVLPNIPTNTNTRGHSQFTWQDLRRTDVELYDKIRVMGEEFGY